MVRIIATLRAINDNDWVYTSDEFCKDVNWFLHFASASNGVLLYNPDKPVFQCECDSSLEAAGGFMTPYYYNWVYTDQHRQAFPSIHELEAINLLITYKTFAKYIPDDNALVIIFTDNIASSYALETGRTKDTTLASCARELWLLAARRSHTISIRHKPGVQLEFVDALSRMHSSHSKTFLVKDLVSKYNLIHVPPVLNQCKFFTAFL